MFEICKYSVWISYLNLLWSANPVTLWIDFISSSNSLNHFENNITFISKYILQFPPTWKHKPSANVYLIAEQNSLEYKMDHASESRYQIQLSLCNYPALISDNCSLVGWVTNALGHATQRHSQRKYWSVQNIIIHRERYFLVSGNCKLNFEAYYKVCNFILVNTL